MPFIQYKQTPLCVHPKKGSVAILITLRGILARDHNKTFDNFPFEYATKPKINTHECIHHIFVAILDPIFFRTFTKSVSTPTRPSPFLYLKPSRLPGPTICRVLRALNYYLFTFSRRRIKICWTRLRTHDQSCPPKCLKTCKQGHSEWSRNAFSVTYSFLVASPNHNFQARTRKIPEEFSITDR